MIKIVRAKLHGIRVTGADLDYHGSITLDPVHCAMAGILPLEFVHIWNKSNGARIETYVIFGEAYSGCCVLNGAAARICQKGDEIIICASEYIVDPSELVEKTPKLLTFGEGNIVREILEYSVGSTREGKWSFTVREAAGGGV
ncbi:MAG: aspartate 1-decarboxylase [Desulfovibrio sp.]|nr:aspartate 1-decarboxylase [Desulfovibrio sp.]